jgi:N,N-dimethylformamidase
VGYADRISVQPGEDLAVYVSATAPSYDVDLVEVARGEDKDGQPAVEEIVHESGIVTDVPGRHQRVRMGSYVRVPDAGAHLDGLAAATVTAWILPTILPSSAEQVIVSTLAPDAGGWELTLAPEGHLEFRVRARGREASATGTVALRAFHWYFVHGGYDCASDAVVVGHRPLNGGGSFASRSAANLDPVSGHHPVLLIGARPVAGVRGAGASGEAHFNGRIENPRVFSWPPAAMDLGAEEVPVPRAEEVVAAWDFGREFASLRVLDVGPRGLHGSTVNMPTRAVAGHLWDGSVLDFRSSPEQYTAIHFHADDVADADWEKDFDLRVPQDLDSGVYAVRLRAEDRTDHIPFVVLPRRGQPSAQVVLLLPTFTYQAYGNNRVPFERDLTTSGVIGLQPQPDIDPKNSLLRQHREWGRSLYDVSADGSGVVYASRKRPLVNMRPAYRHWITGAGRNFSADLYLVHWLNAQGIPYDVITDEELTRYGVEYLEPYRLALTGSHPEYATLAMLDALEDYTRAGGRLMYLGGNGFYWVTSVHGERGDVIEVRRGHAGTRPWEQWPGEAHHSTTGEPGGLWRHRGRPSDRLVGVSFCAQGWSPRAGYYERLPVSYESKYRWIFRGLEAQRCFGDFGLIMGGAAGDEIDHYSSRPGAPDETVVLARSAGHSEQYCLAVEELLQTGPNIDATRNADVHADLTYRCNEVGGAVFSVGSMCWVGALPVNRCRNDVSTITANVVNGLLQALPP